MSSLLPQQSQPSRTAARRRQRSTRLSVAVAAVVLAGLLVLGAVVSGSFLLAAAAGVLAVALGGAATKITHTELVDGRVQAARDRAAQARDYAALTERRTTENLAFARDMRSKIDARQEVIAGLEQALSNAQRQVLEQTRKLNTEARRADLAETARVGLERSLSTSEDRAADAIVLVAELEAEIDVLRSELASWQSAAARNRASSA